MWGKQKQAEEKVECSMVKGLDIFIEATPKQKIQALMDEYSHQEWLAYLVGRLSEKGNIFVEDISVPPHAYAHGASAEAEPLNVPDDCVGIIHSHHTMGAFHSATDKDYVDKNYPVSITVARNGNSVMTFDAVSYGETPCGKYIEKKATVKYVQPPPMFDKEGWLKEAKENIDKGKTVYTPINNTPYGYLDSGRTGTQGRFCEQEPYVPYRYRRPGGKKDKKRLPIITQNGRVLTDKEYEDMINNSEEDWWI